MGYAAKILADSTNPAGVRLITFEITFPRIVLAEFNTHRVFSRNSASSRAIPTKKLLYRVLADPFVPEYFGKNQKGMQARAELSRWRRSLARATWLFASRLAVALVWLLSKLDLHKQISNRLLEPFLWHTVIVTSSEWANFFALRCHPDAQPEIREIAVRMRDLERALAHRSKRLVVGEWHLPLVTGLDWTEEVWQPPASHSYASSGNFGLLSHDQIARVSSARCARVSFLTHDGRRSIVDDLALATKLQDAGHMSPFEHVARAEADTQFRGNIRGFTQLRKLLPDEAVFRARNNVSKPPTNRPLRAV